MRAFHADRHARIVIIGGGSIGTSVAYHLARAGERDVLLLEKARLTEGCTWHAAGLVGQLRGTRNLTRLMQDSVAVFDRLGKEADAAIDWKKVGSLRIASSPERWSEIRRSTGQAKSFGVDCEVLTANEAVARFPHIDPAGIEGAIFLPGDGYIDPYGLTQAYAKVARKHGARIEEGIGVTEIVRDGRRVLGVVTDHGTVGCDVLVNCAGLWAKTVAEMAGVPLAVGVVEHQYFLTEKALDLPPDLTTLRDPDNNFYLKPDVGAFAIGGWEDGAPECWGSTPPAAFGRELFAAQLDRLEKFALPAATRLPVLNEIGIRTVINGPIPVSADGEPILGLAPGTDNFHVACGFTAGIAASGGAGLAMANWILEGDPGMDLWALDVRRFGPLHAAPGFLGPRAEESYAGYYKIHWPGEEKRSARDLRLSPLHARLEAAGAVFGSKFGWERANWFAQPGEVAVDRPRFDKPNWFDAVAEECRAIRHAVAVIDQTSFAKFEIAGPDAEPALQWIAANDVAVALGRAVYTQFCNDRGGIEADVTLIRRAPDRYMLVTGAGFGVRDRDWVERNLPAGSDLAIRDVTDDFAVINLCGPGSRDVLAAVSDADASGAGHPFLAARDILIGDAAVLAVRIGYVGELGYELYVEPAHAVAVHDRLMRAAAAHGIRHAGYRAIESCRLEKGYLYWSGDIGPDIDPYAAGLGFCIALDKGDFLGRAALARIRETGPERRLATLSVEGFVPLHGGEPVFYGSGLVGATASCGYGHALGRTIAFSHLPADLVGDRFEIEAFGRRYGAIRGPRCLYDAGMERLKA